MNIKTASLCDQGGRPINDDTVRIQEDGGRLCVYVGDGLGGYAGGKQASESAGEALMALGSKSSLLTDAQLLSAASQAEQAVRRTQQEGQLRHYHAAQGDAQVIIGHSLAQELAGEMHRVAEQARWMHVGDSRLYHFRDGKLQTQTMDHSVSQMAVLMGDITPQEIRFHEDRNRVLRALGGDNAKPDLSPILVTAQGKDAFLLCTDGF